MWSSGKSGVRNYRDLATYSNQITGGEIQVLSIDGVRRLLVRVTGLEPKTYHMCRDTCRLFTGRYSENITCGVIHDKRGECMLTRYDESGVGRYEHVSEYLILTHCSTPALPTKYVHSTVHARYTSYAFNMRCYQSYSKLSIKFIYSDSNQASTISAFGEIFRHGDDFTIGPGEHTICQHLLRNQSRHRLRLAL